MKRKMQLVLCAGFLVMSITACGTKQTEETIPADETEKQETAEDSVHTTESSATEEPATEKVDTELPETETETEREAYTELTFADLATRQFEFSSGVGGWSTDFVIEKDGYFHGTYHDSDMGVTGEDYENGTMYYSDFSGHFTDLTKVNDHCYEMTLADISYADEVGTEDILDGVHYIYLDAYGLTGTDRFLIYLPGTPVSEFSEDVYGWLSMANQSDTELTMMAIVNAPEQEGICSYERMDPLEDAEQMLKGAKESNEYWLQKIDTAESQIEIDQIAQARYEAVDGCLNGVWNLLKYNTDETVFETIRDEQREWIAYKENEAEQAAAEYGGGSMATAVSYDTLTELTLARLEELVAYLK